MNVLFSMWEFRLEDACPMTFIHISFMRLGSVQNIYNAEFSKYCEILSDL